MVKKNSQKNITNIAGKEFTTRMMGESVKKCFDKDLFLPALILICCYIDGLSNGEKDGYIKNLKLHFPDLCKELGAQIFYQKYRNGVIHEFGMKDGFALGRGGIDINSCYIQEQIIEESRTKLFTLNIDRFVKEFLDWIKIERTKI